jgi:hypothetical protein
MSRPAPTVLSLLGDPGRLLEGRRGTPGGIESEARIASPVLSVAGRSLFREAPTGDFGSWRASRAIPHPSERRQSNLPPCAVGVRGKPRGGSGRSCNMLNGDSGERTRPGRMGRTGESSEPGRLCHPSGRRSNGSRPVRGELNRAGAVLPGLMMGRNRDPSGLHSVILHG